MHRSDAYSSTSYSRGIRWLPSPEVCRMVYCMRNCQLLIRTVLYVKKRKFGYGYGNSLTSVLSFLLKRPWFTIFHIFHLFGCQWRFNLKTNYVYNYSYYFYVCNAIKVSTDGLTSERICLFSRYDPYGLFVYRSSPIFHKESSI